MSFSFSKLDVRPASFAEHASIKEKMRKHLRKSAFVSDEQGEWCKQKLPGGSDMLNRSGILNMPSMNLMNIAGHPQNSKIFP